MKKNLVALVQRFREADVREKRNDSVEMSRVDEAKEWEKFKSYLRELAKQNDKPFNCPLLAVVPELVRCQALVYQKGSLVCCGLLDREDVYEDAFCRIGEFEGRIDPNSTGQIEFRCEYNDSKFTFSLAAFEPSK